jgi:hypothetical protein
MAGWPRLGQWVPLPGTMLRTPSAGQWPVANFLVKIAVHDFAD